MKLLALSTSTPRGSAALFHGASAPDVGGPGPQGGGPLRSAATPGVGGRLLAAATYVDLRGHAESIFGAIDEVLRASGVSRAAIKAIGCDIGPGSFTGVRVAVATAKGIAVALGIPTVGVTSLEAMARAAFGQGAADPGDLLVAMIDAKKGEVFLAAFDAPGGSPLLAPQHLPRDAAFAAIAIGAAGRRIVVAGEVAEEIALLRPHRVRGEGLDFPDALWIGQVALERFDAAFAPPERAGTAGEHDPALLEPLYVRAPDAKLAELG